MRKREKNEKNKKNNPKKRKKRGREQAKPWVPRGRHSERAEQSVRARGQGGGHLVVVRIYPPRGKQGRWGR